MTTPRHAVAVQGFFGSRLFLPCTVTLEYRQRREKLNYIPTRGGGANCAPRPGTLRQISQERLVFLSTAIPLPIKLYVALQVVSW